MIRKSGGVHLYGVSASFWQRALFKKEQVSALCVSSHTPTLTPVKEDGEPLMNGMIWADGRAVEESLELQRDYGKEIASVNPASIRPYHIVSKLFWFKKI